MTRCSCNVQLILIKCEFLTSINVLNRHNNDDDDGDDDDDDDDGGGDEDKLFVLNVNSRRNCRLHGGNKNVCGNAAV